MREKGFTLVELLVVIAIIALLMSILMPALSRAKKQAMRVVCLNNCKQMGMAAILYAEDYDEYLPRNGGRWITLFMPYIGGLSNNVADYREVEVYNCPMYPDKKQTVDYVVSSWHRSESGSQEYKGYTKLSEWRSPAQKIYLADNEFGYWRPIIRNEADLRSKRGVFDVWKPIHLPSWPVDRDFDERRAAKARHKDGCNAVYLDGRSDWVKAEDNLPNLWNLD